MLQAVPLEIVRIQLNTDHALQQQIPVFNSFDPRSFLPPLDDVDLPDTATGDALAELLASDRGDYQDAVDDFLDSVDEDPDLEGFDANWADVIDLETERILADEDFDAAEADVMVVLEQANRLPEQEAMELTSNLPVAQRDNSAVIALARDIVDENPLHEMADVARLYAAQGMTDYASGWISETQAIELLLDTLANSGSSDVQEQAIRMLVETAPGKLHPGDIELLENTWYTLDDTMQSQLSRFLTTQHFAIGDLEGASVWTDRFEAEVLTGEMDLATHDDFLREIDHARARIGARRGDPPRTWKVAVEQAAWACWEGPDRQAVTAQDDRLEIRGMWNNGWSFQAETEGHPLSECVLMHLAELDDIQEPLRVRLSIHIFGVRD